MEMQSGKLFLKAIILIPNPKVPHLSSVLDKNQFNMLSSVALIDINEFTNSGLGLRTSQQSFWFTQIFSIWKCQTAERSELELKRATLKFSRLYCQFVLGSYQQAHEVSNREKLMEEFLVFYLFCHCEGEFWNWLRFRRSLAWKIECGVGKGNGINNKLRLLSITGSFKRHL